MTRRVQNSNSTWRALGSIMPDAPDPSDPRGEAILFHGRYRGAHNTGVPDKGALGLPRFGKLFDTPGETISDQHFIGFVEISAPGVTFERCYFECRNDTYLIQAHELTTFYDCEFNGGKALATAAITTGTLRAVRCHFWGTGNDCIGFGDNTSYEDSYIHTTYTHYGSHNDIGQTLGGVNLAVKRCKLLAYDPYTGERYNAALQLGTVGPPLNGLEISDCYFDGGGYTFNGQLNGDPQVSNVVIEGNRWGRNYAYGPITTLTRVEAPHGTFSNNVMDDTGELL